MIAQAYLEVLRAVTVSNGGPWIFHSVRSVSMSSHHIYVRSEQRCRHIIETVQKEAQLGNLGQSLDSIVDALYHNNLRKLDPLDFLHFDYILVWDKRQVDALQRLSKNISSHCQRTARKAQILLLSGVDVYGSHQVQDLVTLICSSVKRLLEQSFDWNAPNPHSTEKIITTFVRIVMFENRSFVFGDDYYLQEVVRVSGCRLYMCHHASIEQAEVVALVGTRDQSTMAKKYLQEGLSKKDLGRVKQWQVYSFGVERAGKLHE